MQKLIHYTKQTQYVDKYIYATNYRNSMKLFIDKNKF